MWEIIALYFLTRRIGIIAASKGLSPRQWKLYVILAWFVAESVGIVIGIKIYNIDMQAAASDFSALISSKSFMMTNLIGWGFAIASYFTIRDILQKKDDVKAKRFDINQHVED